MHYKLMEESSKTGLVLDKETVKSLYEAGNTVKEIGKMFDKNYMAMRGIFCKLGISREGYQIRKGRKIREKNTCEFQNSVTEADFKKVTTVLEPGKRINIGRTGVDQRKIQHIAKVLGVPVIHERFAYDWNKINKQLKTGDIWSVEEAEKLTGITGFRLMKFTSVKEVMETKPTLDNIGIIDFMVSRNLDITNNGIAKIIKKYPVLYRSIITATEDHKLSTKKITEKVWRISNGVASDFSVVCEKCYKPVGFGMYVDAYTTTKNGKLKVCSKCGDKSSSMISQKLFFKLLPHLEDKDLCFFGEHGGEKKILMSEIPETFLLGWNHNTLYMRLDFCYKNFVIEYHGSQHHTKDSVRDADRKLLLEKMGYKVLYVYAEDTATLYKDLDGMAKACLEFLHENK